MPIPLKAILFGLLITSLLVACTPTREQMRQAFYQQELQSLAGDSSLSETEKVALAAEAADFVLAIMMFTDGEIALEDVPPKPALFEMRDQQRAASEGGQAAEHTVVVVDQLPPPPIEPQSAAPTPQPASAPAQTIKPSPEPQTAPAPSQPTAAVAAATAPVADGQYSDWLFLRSDKWAFQYRMTLVEQAGTTARLRLQLRIDETSRDFCTDPRCDGYVATLRYANEDNETVALHFRIHPGYSGIHTIPSLLSTSLITFPDGSSRAYDPGQGVVIYDAPGQRSRDQFISGCLDDPLVGRQHRCHWDFDPAQAQHIH